jgi:hypothetical protein
MSVRNSFGMDNIILDTFLAILIEKAPADTICASEPDPPWLRPPNRLAAVMVLAPVLGLAVWAALLALLI